ncbi:MAG: Holliday junction resolvase RuvX, partial [Solirubrobacterales bacterium]|nr:Holliday junction resolvase RuvX [Solirubrobacterales bacterium]
MRVLALDLGTVRIGVAVSDATGTLASPLTTVPRSPAAHAAVADLVAEEGAELVIVGLPRNMDGSLGPAARAAEAEAEELRGRLAAPVLLVDERLTTVAADRALAAGGRSGRRRRQVVDQAAAAVLLQ